MAIDSAGKFYTKVYWRSEEDYNFVMKRLKAFKIYNKQNGQPNMSLALSDLGRHGKFETHLRLEINNHILQAALENVESVQKKSAEIKGKKS